jgi:outer membrane receptor protein involved in Fe transport
LADLGPIQSQTISQNRTLLNAGIRSDYSVQTGRHNIKIGGLYQQTFLRERDPIGLINSTSNSPCLDAGLNPVSGFTDPSQCIAAGLQPNDGSNPDATVAPFNPVLLPYDLTRGGANYNYFGHTDVKELALYIQDQIKAGNWLFNVGIRGDLYNGLAIARQAEPRLGVSYSVKQTGTVLRVSYARTLETPFNENLVLSSQGCAWIPERVSCRIPAGVRKELCCQRRLHLEVHAQRVRLRHPRQHAYLLPHRLAQLEDPWLCDPC